ncbi:BnaC09g08910D [Brassica napus]|uniref:KIB1-4 beta-propeller domain-containing protein n=4 Tax=Brassica TaxID=3705 RepID=A0A0D3E303_BRAOL|nr:PREDICTED: putative F-box protein At2g16290 [Brassica oleracea var. oleracea]XP_013646735.1 putative F-box protein At2g16290 [Brassica napus]CAF1717542.1 unnamed protein product [Brassica napus]CDY26764.1 BnaC09g08910D [Brassica napus]VDD28863.1 unnamed protein product [Brassica oleracea]
MADWSLLHKDLLERINGCFETCFEIVHFRSVCSSWRSAISLPSYKLGLGVSCLLPAFNHDPRFEVDTQCMLEKIPVFLLRFQTPFGIDYMLVGTSERKSGKQKLLSPFTDYGLASKSGIILNTLSCQIIPLGHYYKIRFYAITTRRSRTRRQSYAIRVAFLPLDSKDDREFAIVAGVFGDLMMYRSCDKVWIKMEGRFKSYRDMVLFKGEVYVVDMSGRGHVFVIDPSKLVTEILSVTQSHESFDERLVISGEELLLVQRFTPGAYGHEYMHTWFKLFRLEEEGQNKRWVPIDDLEDRVVFLGYEHDWNLCYSANELPGMIRNCVMFIEPSGVFDRIRVFDLRTQRTRKASECSGCIDMYSQNVESSFLCGILATPNPTISIYDLSSESE